MNEQIKVLKKIKKTDLEYGLLILSAKELEPLLKYKGKKVWIKDNLGCQSFSISNDTNENSLRISGLTEWYKNRNLSYGTEICIRFDEEELFENLHIIHIEYIPENSDNDEEEKQSYKIQYNAKCESDLEYLIKNNPDCIEPKLKLYQQQYKINSGVIDLLFLDRNNNFVVVELKNKKSSDEVVGQISRYIGCLKKDYLKNEKATIRGIILSPEYDKNLDYAVAAYDNLEVRYFNFNIEFY